MTVLLGCIADDSTGASDLANTLVKQGMRTIQIIGVPEPDRVVEEVDAVVVALKSRTNPVGEAIAQSLSALAWLREQGAEQVYFKYCSTFDSTDDGNIGPVAEALMAELGTNFTVACPAFPTAGRTIYKGNLFVGDQLLSESSMKDHPLTPMRDANLVRVLGRQCNGRVGLVDSPVIAKGVDAVREGINILQQEGYSHAILDAINDEDLMVLGAACADLKLITGGSGMALGLPENFRRRGLLGPARPAALPGPRGLRAVLAGSCSVATRGQVTRASAHWPSYMINPVDLFEGRDVLADILSWLDAQPSGKTVLIYSSAEPAEVEKIQTRFGRSDAGEIIERTFGELSRQLVARGVRELIVAGGETSGAVVQALGIDALRIGPEIDPGVPWTETVSAVPLSLALKSGNFGSEDFFAKAFAMLEG